MIGPGNFEVPAQSQALLGEIKVSDLVEDDLTLFSVNASTIGMSGTVKSVTKPWTDFQSSGDNTGHFIPITLPAEWIDKDAVFKGKTADSDFHVDDDRILVVRLENLIGLEASIWLEGKEQMGLNFKGIVPVGKDAYNAQKTDFGGYGNLSDYVDGLSIRWDGVKGTAKGKLLNHGEVGTKKVSAGHHFPLALSDWYFDDIKKTVGIKNPREDSAQDWILAVEDTEKPIRVEYHGMTVMEIDLSGMELAE